MKPLSLLPLILLAVAPLPSPVHSWGQLPHRTIALLSTRFLLPETAAFIRNILPKDETIAEAAIWGDYFSHTPEGRWSGMLHYIDAHDNPANGVCGIDYERDCPEGKCVVGGIANVTSQLQPPDLTPLPPPSPPVDHPHRPPRRNPPRRGPPRRGPPRRGRPHQSPLSLETDLLDTTPSYHPYDSTPPHWATPAHLSLRLLIHFISDVHQPLHTESLSHGGNSIHIKFFDRDANLHSAWDSLIPQQLRQGRTPRHATLWANELHDNITSFTPETLSKWGGDCFSDIEKVISAHNGKIPEEKALQCAMEWARYTNSYVCSYVFKEGFGVDEIHGMELSGEYTTGAKELVDELVGMAGWRLGGWLNLVVTGRLGLDLGENTGSGSQTWTEIVSEEDEEEAELEEEAEEEERVMKINEEVSTGGGWKERVGGFAQRALGRVRELEVVWV